MLTSMSNGAYSTLASGITSGATSLSVASGEGARFPASNFYISVYDSIYPNWAVAYRNGAGEIMLCSSRSTDTFTVTRAQGSTSAVAFNATGRTYRVEQNATAEAFAAASETEGGVVSTIAQAFAGLKSFIAGITVGKASTNIGNVRYYNNSNAFTTDVTSGIPSADAILTLPTRTGTLATTYDVANPSYYTFHDDLDGTFSGAEVSDKLFIASGTLNNTYIPSISSGIYAYGQYGIITSTTNQAARFQSHAINSPATKPSGYILPIPNMIWKARVWLPDDALGNFPKWFAGLFSDNNVSIGVYFMGGATNSRSLSCTTNGTTTLSSSALFSYRDIGSNVTGTGIPANTKIVRFVSTSSVIMSNAATDSTTTSRTFADTGTWLFCTYNATDGLNYVDTGVTTTVGAYYRLEMRSSDTTGDTITPYINGTAYSTLELNPDDIASGLVSMAGVKNSTSGNQAVGLDYIKFTFPDNR